LNILYHRLNILNRIINPRFIKFGAVGGLGTLINLSVLYINQEFLLRDIDPKNRRLFLSLFIAILISTFNNYLWNRMWTWKDRKALGISGFFRQMIRYYIACGVAICFQYIFTIVFAIAINYIFANILAIGLAALLSYLLNDIWTFYPFSLEK